MTFTAEAVGHGLYGGIERFGHDDPSYATHYRHPFPPFETYDNPGDHHQQSRRQMNAAVVLFAKQPPQSTPGIYKRAGTLTPGKFLVLFHII